MTNGNMPPELPNDAANETPDEAPVRKPDEMPDNAPNEIPGDVTPAETPNEMPDEAPDEKPNEIPGEMPAELPDKLSGIILGEQSILTLTEISGACAVQAEYIVGLVEEGLITPEISVQAAPKPSPQFSPETQEPYSWRFTGMHMRHARIASHLQSDLGVNLAGVALALQLLDEVETLRTRLNATGRWEQQAAVDLEVP